MAFWTDKNSLEPLRQHKWYMSLYSTSFADYVFALKECSKPSYKIETTSHVLINHTFNFPKNLVWQPINVKMVTARNNCNCVLLSQALDSSLTISGYIRPDQPQTKQLSKVLMQERMSGIGIIQVDENGLPLETWDLKNAMITEVKYGNLSYENEGFVDVDFSIVYDFAVFNASNSNASESGLDARPVSPGFPSEPTSTIVNSIVPLNEE